MYRKEVNQKSSPLIHSASNLTISYTHQLYMYVCVKVIPFSRYYGSVKFCWLSGPLIYNEFSYKIMKRCLWIVLLNLPNIHLFAKAQKIERKISCRESRPNNFFEMIMTSQLSIRLLSLNEEREKNWKRKKSMESGNSVAKFN